MAPSPQQRSNRNADGVQNKSVPRVPDKGSEQIQDARRVRLLDVRPFAFHNRHVSSGTRRDARCAICSARMGSTIGYVEREVREPVVGEGGGADEPEAATSTRGGILEELFRES